MIAADMQIHSPRGLTRSEGRQRLSAFYVRELGEPLQSVCHDDSIICIVPSTAALLSLLSCLRCGRWKTYKVLLCFLTPDLSYSSPQAVWYEKFTQTFFSMQKMNIKSHRDFRGRLLMKGKHTWPTSYLTIFNPKWSGISKRSVRCFAALWCLLYYYALLAIFLSDQLFFTFIILSNIAKTTLVSRCRQILFSKPETVLSMLGIIYLTML